MRQNLIIRKSSRGIKEKAGRKKAGLYILSWIILLSFVVSCATVKEPPPPKIPKSLQSLQMKERIEQMAKRLHPATLPPLAEMKPRVAVEEKMPYEGKLFSFSARNTPLQDVLLGLAKEAGMNLVIEKGVNPVEPVSAEFRNLSLKTALDTILSACEYFYKVRGNVLTVKAFETRIFRLNYPLVYNEPTSKVGGDILGEAGSDDSSTELSGEFQVEAKITDKDHLNVWKQVEEALSPPKEGDEDKGGLLSPEGRAQINYMSGTIVVTDRRKNILIVENFLKEVSKGILRQVVIEAKIIEVKLDYMHQYGIDWGAVHETSGGTFNFGSNFATALAANTGIASSAFTATTGTWALSGMIDALKTQGDVNVLSSPRLSVLNNQSALISVGRMYPYLDFTIETVSAGDVVSYKLVPTVKNAQEGITLGITPQISETGVTTLHIVPIITEKVGDQAFTYENTNWTVPIFDIQETDTIVRAVDGSTIIIGGLIKDRTSDVTKKIPLLGDIPFIGRLFSHQTKINKKSELVILLTPTVVE